MNTKIKSHIVDTVLYEILKIFCICPCGSRAIHYLTIQLHVQ